MFFFDRLTKAICVVPPTPTVDPRCNDAAFSLANPAICNTIGALIIKPAKVFLCELESVQFKAYEYLNGVESELTSGITFTSSDPDVFTVGVNSGSGTSISSGLVNITATDGDRIVTALVTVLPGDNCCAAISVQTAIVVDNSRSMSLSFGGGYATRLAFAKAVGVSYGGLLMPKNTGVNDSDKVWSVNSVTEDILGVFSTDTAAITAAILAIGQTQATTNLLEVFAFAANDLLADSGDRKVLLIISDGEHVSSATTRQSVFTAANAFKESGGTVIAIGMRASGNGYDMLERIASGGFFINATSDNITEVLDGLNYMKNLLCAGSCLPEGDTWINLPELNYSNFLNWEVASGQVNLLGPGLLDLQPGHGLYVDLTFSGAPVPSTIRTIDAFSLVTGHTYTISFKLAGNQVHNVATIPPKVYLRSITAASGDPNIFEGSPSVAWNGPFTTFNYSFTAMQDVTARLYFEHQPVGSNSGILLDDVSLLDATTGASLLSDDFNSENLTYVPPRCGPSDAITAVDDPTAPNVTQVPYANGDNCNGNSYSYKVAWVTDAGETAASSPVATLVTTVVADQALRLDLPEAPVPVTAVRIYRNVINGNSTDLYQIAVLPAGTGVYFDTETHAEFLARYDIDLTPPTVNTTGRTSGQMGTGIYCYGYDCTSAPPGVQSPDPNPLPDIESGFTPPTTYSSTKTKCETCPTGSTNVSETALASTLVSSSDVSPEYYIDQMTAGAVALGKFCVKGSAGTTIFNDLKLYGGNAAAGPWTLLVTAGTPLTLASNQYGCFLIEGSLAYSFYKVEVSNVQSGSPSPVHIVNFRQPEAFFGVVNPQACASGSATSSISQQDADNRANNAASAAAFALLNCTPSYVSNQSFTASCPIGSFGSSVTKNATRQSLISQADADFQALQAAQTAAEAEIDCGGSNNTQKLTIGNAVGPARPYPSVEFVSGFDESEVITKVTLTLKKVGSNVNLLRYVNAILVSPQGTAVNFYRKVVHNCAVPIELSNPAAFPFGSQRVNSITFDDSAATPFPVCPPSPAGDLNANADYTFQPTVDGAATDLPAPAPAGPYGLIFSDFDGESPNGSWSLWVAVETEPYYGMVCDLGWELTVTI